MRLQGKVAVVTGATSGVGRSIALALAGEGAGVALLGRRAGLLRAVTRECLASGSKVIPYRVDLINEREIRQLKLKVIRDFGGVDILVHSAGVFERGNIAAASLSDFDRQYQCNVRVPFALTQLFVASLIQRKGQIVFINSTAGLTAAAGVSQYSATKHALKALADSFRDELNSSGVRVMSAYLGRTATPMQAKVHVEEGRDYHPERLIQPDQVAESVVAALVLGPEAEVMDIRIRPMQKL
jgi:NAD(P)-dependent dehydrogenase (short-subunit alcohol dehydrogenase family)